ASPSRQDAAERDCNLGPPRGSPQKNRAATCLLVTLRKKQVDSGRRLRNRFLRKKVDSNLWDFAEICANRDVCSFTGLKSPVPTSAAQGDWPDAYGNRLRCLLNEAEAAADVGFGVFLQTRGAS